MRLYEIELDEKSLFGLMPQTAICYVGKEFVWMVNPRDVFRWALFCLGTISQIVYDVKKKKLSIWDVTKMNREYPEVFRNVSFKKAEQIVKKMGRKAGVRAFHKLNSKDRKLLREVIVIN